MINNKVPGEIKITAEMIKGEEENLIIILHDFIRSIWNLVNMRVDWTVVLIIPLYTKGDKSNCDNYSGSALLDILH